MEPGEKFCFRFASEIDEGARVQKEIMDLVETLDYSPRDQFGIRLALEEAVVNAIRHGNGLAPDKNVEVSGQITAERCCLKITDEGPGFDPAEIPDPTDEANLDKPNGRGIMLMRSFMTSVEFSASGNSVTLLKLNVEGNGQAT